VRREPLIIGGNIWGYETFIDLVSLAMAACAMDSISNVPSLPCMDPLSLSLSLSWGLNPSLVGCLPHESKVTSHTL